MTGTIMNCEHPLPAFLFSSGHKIKFVRSESELDRWKSMIKEPGTLNYDDICPVLLPCGKCNSCREFFISRCKERHKKK